MNIGRDIFMQMEIELSKVKPALAAQMCVQLKTLLETKFMYQAVSIEPEKCLEDVYAALKSGEYAPRLADEVKDFSMTAADFGMQFEEIQGGRIAHRVFPPATVNTRCECCKEITPHNPTCACTLDGVKKEKSFDETFLIDMACQKCKRSQLQVLVRRTGFRLQIVGRSQVDYCPLRFDLGAVGDKKEIANIFCDAEMAFRTGSELAAVCLLRVAIEQYMRSVAGLENQHLSGDEIYDAYDMFLPTDFPRSRVVSLKQIYKRLSEIMHGPKSLTEGEFAKWFDEATRFFDYVKLFPVLPEARMNDEGDLVETGDSCVVQESK